jgi:hypothetical protein
LSYPSDFRRNSNGARQLYGADGVPRALVEAIELWLAQHRQNLIEPERAANDKAYAALAAELEQKHPGQWTVIAHGRLQGVGASLDQVAALAPTAPDRLVFQVGAAPSLARAFRGGL